MLITTILSLNYHTTMPFNSFFFFKEAGVSESLFFFDSKITADGDCAMKLRHLFLVRKAMTKLDSTLKSSDTTLSTKVHLVKAMVFQ